MFDEREEMLRREAKACEAAYVSGLVPRPIDYVVPESDEQAKSRNHRIAIVEESRNAGATSIEDKLMMGKGELRRTHEIIKLLQDKGQDYAAALVNEAYIK